MTNFDSFSKIEFEFKLVLASMWVKKAIASSLFVLVSTNLESPRAIVHVSM